MKVLFASKTVGPHDQRFLEGIASLGHEVKHLRLSTSGPLSCFDFLATPSTLKGVCDEIRHSWAPDLIHCGPLQEVTFPLLGQFECPILPMSWGSDVLLPDSTDFLWQYALKKVLEKARVFLADCKAVEDTVLDLGFNGRVVRFPWGVDLENHHFSTLQFADESNVQVFTCRNFFPIYDVETVLRGFGIVAQERTNLRFAIAGAGPDEALLKDLAASLKIPNVTFYGSLSASELQSLRSRSHIYVSASRSDGSSVSLLEAMSEGIPVVASDIPGNREWVHGNGKLFEVGNPEDLARKLLEVLEGDMVAMAECGRSKVEESADWRRSLGLLNEAYHEAVG